MCYIQECKYMCYTNCCFNWISNVFRFKIDDIPAEKAYKISASLSVCFGVGPCVLDSLELLKDFKLPKTLCEWGTGFVIGTCIHGTDLILVLGIVSNLRRGTWVLTVLSSSAQHNRNECVGVFQVWPYKWRSLVMVGIGLIKNSCC